MKVAMTIVTLLIGLLSLAAGAAKIALVPEEVRFLSQFGFTSTLTITFGIAQLVGGLLLVLPATRLYGAGIAGIAFAISALLLLLDDNLVFAGVSLVPVILSGLIAYRSYVSRTTPTLSEGDA